MGHVIFVFLCVELSKFENVSIFEKEFSSSGVERPKNDFAFSIKLDVYMPLRSILLKLAESFLFTRA